MSDPNPYAPPKSEVRERSVRTVIPELSDSVLTGMRFIWVYLWMNWIPAIYHIVSISLKSEYEPMDLPGLAVVALNTALYAGALWVIRQGHLWGRIALAGFCAVHLVKDLVGFDSTDLFTSIGGLVVTGIPSIGTIWLFRRESSQWFAEVRSAREMTSGY